MVWEETHCYREILQHPLRRFLLKEMRDNSRKNICATFHSSSFVRSDTSLLALERESESNGTSDQQQRQAVSWKAMALAPATAHLSILKCVRSTKALQLAEFKSYEHKGHLPFNNVFMSCPSGLQAVQYPLLHTISALSSRRLFGKHRKENDCDQSEITIHNRISVNAVRS